MLAMTFAMKNTFNLARKLGHIETIQVDVDNNKYSNQQFEYLLVLDFEATCWDQTKTNYTKSEIIEFPVVLFNIKTNKIISEFRQFVMPTENPKLSDFCINFTGITQKEVDNGVPLQTCLMLFSKWIKEIEQKYGLILYKNKESKCNCVFVTWSNWDLGNCLYNECIRKGIRRQDHFKNWIDLRAVYKKFYNKKPGGLKGALNSVGLEFKGREHSGIDDARNTAFLASRMIQDGIHLQIT